MKRLAVVFLFVAVILFEFSVSAATIIVDDQSAQFTRYGTVSYWKEATVGYSSHMYWTYNLQSSTDNYGIWRPSIATAGTYNVYVYIPSSNATTQAAKYKIYDGYGSSHYVTINQLSYSNQWVLLGTYYFSAGTSGYVYLADYTGETNLNWRVGFDAVKWESVDTCGLSGSSLTVTSPNGGEKWVQGNTYNITWNKAGTVSTVRLHLYKGGSMVYVISSGTANDGSFSFTVPASIANGTDYRIGMSNYHTDTACDGQVYDFSNSYFTIESIDSSAFVSDVTIPDGTNINAGSSFTKTWRLKNNGTTTWSSYKLCFVSGSQMSAPSCVNVPTTSPGSNVDVSVNMVAPTSAGLYTGYWKMKNAAGTLFGTQVYVKINSIALTDGSTFVSDVTIPDGTNINAGSSFTKTWRMRNSGTSTWSGYQFCFVSGSQMSAPSCVSVPTTSPGSNVDISVNMIAPTSAGSYTGYWKMKNSSGTSFGAQVYVTINSVAMTDGSTFVSDVTIPDGTNINAGSSFTKTWRMRNSGTSTWSGYQFCFVSGSQMSAPSCVSVPTTSPGSNVDISVNMIAPTSAGSYTGYWKMKNSSGTSFGAQVYVTINSVALTDSSAFVSDVTIPDGTNINAGSAFTKTWRLNNNGSSTWSGYQFCFVSGSQMSAPSCVSVPTTSPGSNVDINVNMIAPTTPGSYTGNWKMKNSSGTSFGAQVYVAINSTGATDSAQFMSETYADGYQLSPYQNFTKKWTIKNNGTTTWTTSYKFVHVSGSLSKSVSDIYLTKTVAPGATYDLSVLMQAPASGTNLEDHWKLVNASGTTINISGTSTIWAKVNVVTGYTAQWVSETITDGTAFSPGYTFVKKWTIKNNGTSAWDSTFKLRRRAVSTPLSTITTQPISGTVAVGSSYTFSVTMTAPQNEGTYQEEWEFVGPAGEIIQIRSANNSWVTSKIWAMISVDLPTTPPDGLPEVGSGNPTYAEINDEIMRLSAANNIPPIILKALAYKEGAAGAKWQQYWTKSGSQYYSGCDLDYPYSAGDIVYGYDDTDGDCMSDKIGIGLMQITIPLLSEIDSEYDQIVFADPVLASDVSENWKANLQEAVNKLNWKWQKNVGNFTGCDVDKSIIENWYYPIAWYNGAGNAAYNYTTVVYNYMRGTSPIAESGIDSYIESLPNISWPRILSGFSTTINDNPTSASEVYTLEDLANEGGKIHKWMGGTNYVDITSEILDGTCEPSSSNEPSALSRVSGVSATIGTIQAGGQNVTIKWQQNPVDQPIEGYYVAWKSTSSPSWNYSELIAPQSTIDNKLSWTRFFSPGSYTAFVVPNNILMMDYASLSVSFTTSDSGNGISAVTGAAYSINGSSVTISWNKNPAGENVNVYQLYIKKSQDTKYYDLSVFNGTSYTSNFVKDETYNYKIKACKFTASILSSIECGPSTEEYTFTVGANENCQKALQNNVIYQNETISAGELKNYCFTLPAGVEVVTVHMSGVGINKDPYDADLYVKHGSKVELSDTGNIRDQNSPILVGPWLDGSVEAVTIYDPPSGSWYVGVHGSSDMNSIGSLNFSLQLHYHTSKREGLPDGFNLNRYGMSTVFKPVYPGVGNWYSCEWKCANGEVCQDGDTACDYTVDATKSITDSCFRNCISPAHKLGDYDSLDFNIAGDVDNGQWLRAGISGTVIFSGYYNGWGNQVVIQSDIDANFAMRYGHMQYWDPANGNPQPAIGQHVEFGDKIGKVGGTGGNWPNHLHLSMHKNLVLNKASGEAMNQATLLLERKGSLPQDREYSAFIPLDVESYLSAANVPKTWTVIETRCPVEMSVVDEFGNRLGKNPFGGIDNEIDGAEYYTMNVSGDEVEVIALPDAHVGNPYYVNIAGIGAGEFNVGISVPEQDQSSYRNLSYLNQPVEVGTQAVLDFTALVNDAPMIVSDESGSYVPEPATLNVNVPVANPIIDSISLGVLTKGGSIQIDGSGFGNDDMALPGEIDIVDGNRLYRPFRYTSWTDNRIIAVLSDGSVPAGSYQLRLMVYPSRNISNKVFLDIVNEDSQPVINQIGEDYVMAESANETVEIYGKGFSDDATVTVNGVQVEDMSVLNSNYIQAKLPSLTAGEYNIVVQNGNGKTTVENVVTNVVNGNDDPDNDGFKNVDELHQRTDLYNPDSDSDGVLDGADALPLDPNESVDTDGDYVGNNQDEDDDEDGVVDIEDSFPLDPSESVDTDGDGIGNNADTDDDADGIPDVDDPNPLVSDSAIDTDGDGVADIADAFPADPTETIDTDGDGIGNNADTDDDNDNVADENDVFPMDNTEWIDTDGDGTGNNADTDDDNDNVSDAEDKYPLIDNNVITNWTFNEGEGCEVVDPARLDAVFGEFSPDCSSGNAPTWQADGADGFVIAFDGIDDYVSFTGSPTYHADSPRGFSLAMMVAVDDYDGSSGEYREIASGGLTDAGGWVVFARKNNGALSVGVQLNINGTSVAAVKEINPATFVHLAFTYNSSNDSLIFYVDGVAYESSAVDLLTPPTGDVFNLGGGLVTGTGYFGGMLDDVNFFEKVLTGAEINSVAIVSGSGSSLPGTDSGDEGQGADVSQNVSNILGPKASMSVTALDFGNVEIDTVSEPKYFAVENTGNEDLLINTVEIDGQDAGNFEKDVSCPPILKPGESCEGLVTFTPDSERLFSAALKVYTNAEGSSPSVLLTGNGSATVTDSGSAASAGCQLEAGANGTGQLGGALIAFVFAAIFISRFRPRR